ncbi:hypothetical protein ACONUD_04450 [Microbulbifer harenosus]|uniref:Phosphodiesterase n=1 Tax=Microbulbifer harenosus TaxID=2576840 RepID=A0ABY2UK44_9GAMM|nr:MULTISPECIES: hypothetical protein [Microbulbifer]QIL89311.1 hypothetical protein GNX18_05675 [Microbulbifer sp. SH-1]TLM78612.1 hypothetical protein FDY93_04935 [Microbulbifer harenosus]
MFSTSILRNLTLAGLVGIAISASVAQAETIEVPVGSQGQVAEATHLRGKKQDQVTQELGEPLNIQGPVGVPAISRWEYGAFYVYFENDRVLHTVAKHQG